MTVITADDLVIKVQHPPNFGAVAAAFPAARKPGVMFCYGDTVYNPSGVHITRELLEHEAVHATRQSVFTPEAWWDEYLKTESFRYEEEVIAHIAEYSAILDMTRNKRQRREYLNAIAHRLSGPLYGHAVDYDRAREMIEANARTKFGRGAEA